MYVHALHSDDPDVLYWPAPHIAAVAFTEPAGQLYPAEHGPLHDDVVSPLTFPNCPAGHSVQLAEPATLY